MTDAADLEERIAKDAVTLNTIRAWVERTIEMTTEAPPRSHSAGFRLGARSVKAILDVHDAPPDAPVNYPNADTEIAND